MSGRLLAAEAATPITLEPVTDFITDVVDRVSDASAAVMDAVTDGNSKVGRFARLALVASLSAGAINGDAVQDLTDQALLERREDKSGIAATGARIGVVVGGAGVVYALLANELGWPLPDMPELPSWGGVSKPEPEKVAAGVDQSSVEEKQEVDINCKSVMSVAVGVTGEKDNGTWQAEGKFDKKIFGDFLLCGPDGSIVSEAPSKIYYDDKTGEIIKIDIVMPQLQPEHPRIDFFNVRNCVNADSDTSMEEVEKMVEERMADIAAGDEPVCDDGFWVDSGGILRPWEGPADPDSTRVITLGYTAAQLAIALDVDPVKSIKEVVDQRQAEYEDMVRAAVRDKYGVTDEMINVIQPETTADEILQQRLAESKAELEGRFSSYEIVQTDEGPRLKVVGPGGEEVEVIFTGFVDIKDLEAANVVLGNG